MSGLRGLPTRFSEEPYFPKYLAALSTNSDALTAARTAFGDLSTLGSALKNYIQQSRFLYWNYDLAVKLEAQDYRTRTVGSDEILAMQAEFLARTAGPDEAIAQLQKALVATPNSPALHTALGLMHVLQNNHGLAKSSLEESLRLGSTDYRTSYHLARLLMVEPRILESNRPQLTALLDSVEQQQPNLSGLHMLRARLYASDPSQADKAFEAGKRALELDPGNVAHRANMGSLAMQLSREDLAKTIGDQLNQLARTPEERRIAKEYGVQLARFLEYQSLIRTPPTEPPIPSSHTPSPGEASVNMPGSSPPSLKFSLPQHLAPLGKEVLALVHAGRAKEATKKVEVALAKAKSQGDRNALLALLKKLPR